MIVDRPTQRFASLHFVGCLFLIAAAVVFTHPAGAQDTATDSENPVAQDKADKDAAAKEEPDANETSEKPAADEKSDRVDSDRVDTASAEQIGSPEESSNSDAMRDSKQGDETNRKKKVKTEDSVEPKDGTKPNSAEPNNNPKPASGKQNESAEQSLSLQLPTQLPGGGRFRRIGVFQSQLSRQIPQDYRPVAIEDLNRAIEEGMAESANTEASQLRSAFYDIELVNDTLVSDRSTIEVVSDRQGVVRRSLGKVNFAIDSRLTMATQEQLPRLEFGPGAELFAVTQGNSSIDFSWSLRGVSRGIAREFKLLLPRTPQTRFLLRTSSDVSVETQDGAIRMLPGPPPDASNVGLESDLQWYVIDAGGLDEVLIRTQKQNIDKSTEAFVVRQSSIRYQVDKSGMNWLSRMTIQPPPGRPVPDLLIRESTITSVNVNSIEIPFTTQPAGGSRTKIRFELPKQNAANSQVAELVIRGHASWKWSGDGSVCDLPLPVWSGAQVMQGGHISQASVIVKDPLRMLTWTLPKKWKQGPAVRNGGDVMFVASGPPIGHAAGALGRTEQIHGSQIRLVSRPNVRQSETSLALHVAKNMVDAKVRIRLTLDRSAIEPVHLELDRGWELVSVSLPKSGRSIESRRTGDGGEVVIWPEAADLDGNDLLIDATGKSPTNAGQDPRLLTVDSVFFLRSNVPGTFTAAVTPVDLNWSGEMAMVDDQIVARDLSKADQTFFQDVSDETLYFRPVIPRVPRLSLQPERGAAFEVDTMLLLERSGNEIIESFVIETDSPSQSLRQLAVQTGPAAGRPPLRWLLQSDRDAIPLVLPSTDVVADDLNGEGVYTIDLSDRNLRDKRLVGRRRYPMSDRLVVRLPSVPRASSQTSEVFLGAGLSVESGHPSVQKVPLDDRILPVLSSHSGSGKDAIRLRYEAANEPSIVIAKTSAAPDVTIVWQSLVKVIASSGGADQVEATYEVSTSKPLSIDYDPNLHLVSVTRGGKSIDLRTVTRRPLILQPPAADNSTSGDSTPDNSMPDGAPGDREVYRIVWNRDQVGSNWIRDCRIPLIQPSGVVVRSEHRFISASDSFAPATLFRVRPLDRSIALPVSPGDTVNLIPRSVALAIGWLFSVLVFAACWYIAQRQPLIVAAIVALCGVTAMLWSPWEMLFIGWVMIPAAAAALLATSLAWHRKFKSARRPHQPVESDNSHDFSVAKTARIVTAFLCCSGFVHAAFAADPSPSPDLVNMLVPVDSEGNLVGNKVYLPAASRDQLFHVQRQDEIQDAFFAAASYSTQLQWIDDSSERGFPTIEADYSVRLTAPSTRLRLPIAPTSIRRIELIQSEQDRLLQFEPDTASAVVVNVPRGDTFRLRVTLIPLVSVKENVATIRLDIPPIASARLIVDAARTIGNVKFYQSAGQVLSLADQRRWTAQLGPEDVIEIGFEKYDSQTQQLKPLVRRYLIHAAQDETTIECEVEPPATPAAGNATNNGNAAINASGDANANTVQLVVLNTSPFKVVSAGWRLLRTEMLNQRQLITMERLTDTPQPIHLLWTLPSIVNRTAFAEEEVSMSIPEVIAPLSGPNASALVGVRSDPDIRIQIAARDWVEPLQFDAAWKGVPSKAERAFVAVDSLPTFVLSAETVKRPTNTESQDMLVRGRNLMRSRARTYELQLDYTAKIEASDAEHIQRVLRVPRRMEIVQLKVNDEIIRSRATPAGAFHDYAIGDLADRPEAVVTALAIMPIPTNDVFAAPKIQIWPPIETTSTFTLSRDNGVSLTPVGKVLPSTAPPMTANRLAKGWIPIHSWETRSGNQDSQIARRFRAAPLPKPSNCEQLTALSWADGRWSMESRIRFPESAVRGYVDIEIPTRWCESLEVKPVKIWSRQPATDPSIQVIRVPLTSELNSSPLTIRGQLAGDDKGRVSVPRVQLLGMLPTTQISVPKRIVTDPIQWRRASLETVALSASWKGTLQGERLTFAPRSRLANWSLDLAPLPQDDSDALALSADVRVFPKADSSLVLARWDVVPGNSESLFVRLPKDSECLGAWSADRAVVHRSFQQKVPSAAGAKQESQLSTIVQVPLSLSRLSQSLQVMIRVPTSVAKRGDYVPDLMVAEEQNASDRSSDASATATDARQMRNVSIAQHWVTTYMPTGIRNNQADVKTQSRKQDRELFMASAVVEAVDRSLDTLADRPVDEVARWLADWVARYQAIAHAAGRSADWDANAEPRSTDTQAEREWRQLDARLGVHVQRYISDDQTQPQPRFPFEQFDGYQIQTVTQLSPTRRPTSVEAISTGTRNLRVMLVNLLGILVAIGICILMYPAREHFRRFVSHPAFWIAVVGLLGFFTSPMPVAGALIIVAIALPVFPSSTASRANSDTATSEIKTAS